jgi:carbon monoxide dehydrogenase subunit G
VKFDHEIVVEAPKSKVREFLDDVPRAAKCVPGLEEITPAGDDTYDGRVRVKIGPLGFNIAGRAQLLKDDDPDSWRLQGEGRDGRAGSGVKAALQANLSELAPARTQVKVSADVQFSGRLSELGQPLIKRKADAMLQDFAKNLQRALASS